MSQPPNNELFEIHPVCHHGGSQSSLPVRSKPESAIIFHSFKRSPSRSETAFPCSDHTGPQFSPSFPVPFRLPERGTLRYFNPVFKIIDIDYPFRVSKRWPVRSLMATTGPHFENQPPQCHGSSFFIASILFHLHVWWMWVPLGWIYPTNLRWLVL
jgi:hypothetical protein